jgi:hypothetical protein
LYKIAYFWESVSRPFPAQRVSRIQIVVGQFAALHSQCSANANASTQERHVHDDALLLSTFWSLPGLVATGKQVN